MDGGVCVGGRWGVERRGVLPVSSRLYHRCINQLPLSRPTSSHL